MVAWCGVEKITVKHVYNCLQEIHTTNCNVRWGLIWRTESSPEVQVRIWKVWHRALPTRTVLRARSMNVFWEATGGADWLANFDRASKEVRYWKDNFPEDLLVML